MRLKLPILPTRFRPLLMAFGSLLPFSLAAQVPYLEIKNHRAEKLVFGKTDTTDYQLKKEVIACLPLSPDAEALNPIVRDLLTSAPDDTLDILLYLHCMWGGQSLYHKLVLRNLAPELLAPRGNIDRIFPLIWHSGMSYRRNLPKAREIGRKTGAIIGEVMQRVRRESEQPVRFYLLCHSMGHQVLRGILAKNKDNPAFTFSQIIFAAADADYDIFAEGNDFSALIPRTKKITVFVNQNDRALKASFKINNVPRLGRAGLKTFVSKKIEVIDVTDIDDVRGLAAKLGGHGYFIASEKVREMIFSAFVGK